EANFGHWPGYDPGMFEPSPERDRRFEVKERWAELVNLPENHADRRTEFYHRQMNQEVDGMECVARALADFPDADWDLRLALARQCYDEARHAEMFRLLLERAGGR